MLSEKGFSLIELLIVIALIAIIAAIATLGSQSYQSRNLVAASEQLYSDMQKIRMDAMTRSSQANSRGFGIRFNSSTAYTIFEFNDVNGNFIDDSGEEVTVKQTTMPSNATVTVNNATDPTGSVRIYDKLGMIRDTAWNKTAIIYVVRLAGVSQARCVWLDTVRIREGSWDGVSTCIAQ